MAYIERPEAFRQIYIQENGKVIKELMNHLQRRECDIFFISRAFGFLTRLGRQNGCSFYSSTTEIFFSPTDYSDAISGTHYEMPVYQVILDLAIDKEENPFILVFYGDQVQKYLDEKYHPEMTAEHEKIIRTPKTYAIVYRESEIPLFGRHPIERPQIQFYTK